MKVKIFNEPEENVLNVKLVRTGSGVTLIAVDDKGIN